jgi:hypothetical protein
MNCIERPRGWQQIWVMIYSLFVGLTGGVLLITGGQRYKIINVILGTATTTTTEP